MSATTGLSVELTDTALAQVQERVERVNKIARKLGVAPMTCEVVGEVWKPRKAGERRFYRTTITGTAPVVTDAAGETYSFVGKVTCDPAGNIIASIDGSPIDPAYRTAEPRCDHCNTRRKRAAMYLFRDTHGDVKAVGHSCIKDFLGYHSPFDLITLIAATQEAIFTYSGEDEDEGFEGLHEGSGERRYNVAYYLAHLAAVVEKYGYTGKTKARETGDTPTCYRLLNNMDSRNRKRLDVTQAHHDMAQAMIGFIRSEYLGKPAEMRTDYEHNLCVTFAHLADTDAASVSDRHLGYAASVIVAYQRHISAKFERENRPASIHLGEVGKPLAFTARIVRKIPVEGYYGTTTVVAFDVDGSDAVWMASGVVDAEVGDVVSVKGRVKEHGEYRERAQTTMTRCKITVIEAARSDSEDEQQEEQGE